MSTLRELQSEHRGGFQEGGVFYKSQSHFDRGQSIQISGGGSQQPTSRGEVTPYLNNFQKNLASIPPVRVPTVQDLTSVLPKTPAPVPVSALDTFNKMRAEQGVSDLETAVNDLTAQEDQLNAQFRVDTTAEKGKPVALNVIAGRIGEQEQLYRENLDFVQRQKSRKIDQLKTSYSLIDTIINLQQTDFNNAKSIYDSEYNKAFQMIDLIQSNFKLQYDVASEERKFATEQAKFAYEI